MKLFTCSSAPLAIALVCLVCSIVAKPAEAVPLLQLDIEGGTYDAREDYENVVAPSSVFTLRAFYNLFADSVPAVTEEFRISIALTPPVNAPATLGSFTVNGNTFQVTGDLDYGTPPVETLSDGKKGDLQTHNIFQTYFTEVAFNFDPNQKADLRDVQTTTGGGLDLGVLGPNFDDQSAYVDFTIDATQLNSEVGLHFDLYHLGTDNKGNTIVDKNAPFSHDAQYGDITTLPPPVVVPEPASIAIWASIGIFGLVVLQRRRRRGAR